VSDVNDGSSRCAFCGGKLRPDTQCVHDEPDGLVVRRHLFCTLGEMRANRGLGAIRPIDPRALVGCVADRRRDAVPVPHPLHPRIGGAS
jgi:hypothetical protein